MYGEVLNLGNDQCLRLEGKLYGVGIEEDRPGFHAELFLDFANRRLKIMDYAVTDIPAMAAHLESLARLNTLEKIIWPARRNERHALREIGFMEEAFFPGMFAGEDGWYLSRFLQPARRQSGLTERADRILASLGGGNASLPPLPDGYELRAARHTDIPALAQLFRDIFSTYPTPVMDEDYLGEELGEGSIFQVAYYEGKLVSAASAEMYHRWRNAEITDCATWPEFRGLSLIRRQIIALEGELAGSGMLNAYSLARAVSPGMNAVLHRLGYEYRGRLLNNCHICGRYEDMNLWVKSLG